MKNEDQIIAGRFRLVERIGAGSSAEVWRAFDERDRSSVAVKLLRRDLLLSTSPEAASAVARFRREITLYERLGPSRFVPDLVAGRAEGAHWYIAMELIEGRMLRAVLDDFRDGVLPPAFMMIGRELTRGLAEIHARGVLHRDLAPDNVAVVELGSGIEVRFLDFGIGKTLEAEVDPVTRQATIAGTPQYLSPEQTRGLDIDAASDVYALGVILYELATGQVPIAVRSFAELARIRREEPLPLREYGNTTWIPEDLLDLVDAMLAKDAADRPDLATLLERFDDYGRRPEWNLVGAEIIDPETLRDESEMSDGERRSSSPHGLEPGQRLGPFRLDQRLAGLGPRETWLAHRPETGTTRVLTCLRLEGEERLQQLELGLALAAREDDKRFRPLVDARLLDDLVVWISPWIEGVTLASEMASGPLPAARILALVRDLAEPIRSLTDARPARVHGYLHPGHVILDEFDTPVLLNAGRSFPWAWSSPFDRNRDEVAYLAPEQAVSGRTTTESEVYGFAALVDALFRGEGATQGPREAQLRAKMSGAPSSPPRLARTPRLRALLTRALDPDPTRRPAPFAIWSAELVDAIGVAFAKGLLD